MTCPNEPFGMRVGKIPELIPPQNLEGETEPRIHASRPRETETLKNPSDNPCHLHQNEFIRRIKEIGLDNNQLEDTAQMTTPGESVSWVNFTAYSDLSHRNV